MSIYDIETLIATNLIAKCASNGVLTDRSIQFMRDRLKEYGGNSNAGYLKLIYQRRTGKLCKIHKELLSDQIHQYEPPTIKRITPLSTKDEIQDFISRWDFDDITLITISKNHRQVTWFSSLDEREAIVLLLTTAIKKLQGEVGDR